jgi:NIMA (never in mitosis gene a)-related kinase
MKRSSASAEATSVSDQFFYPSANNDCFLPVPGAAYLVRHKQENQKYIAKKVMLSGLKQKEKEAAMLEVNLLKNLDHQHIVTYKQSYFTLEQLIIIMEYCEVGDLSYHIKRKIKNNEFFSETEIFNWFIQICLALEYVHARRVIHRDLKAQNIFLTGSLTVKLGDFGISRVLKSSNAHINAMTVVGTPY